MSEPNSSSSEANQRLDDVLEPYFGENYRDKCYLGLMLEQGQRKMVQINVPAHDLPILLQAKPSTGNDPDSGKNRPVVKGHSEEIKNYILKKARNNKPWILGTLTANINPTKIKIIELGRGICFVAIPRGVKLDITDGQHRQRAIWDLIESPESELIGNNDFPITLVLESDFNQCQADFRDMAQTRALDKSLLLSFGEFEGRVGILKKVIDQVPMFQDKTEKIKATPDSKKKLIYTINYLAKAISCAFENEPDNELKNYDVTNSSEALINCFNQFFSECNQTRYIFETQFETLKVEDVAKFQENCLLGRSVGLEILGKLLHYTYEPETNNFIPEEVSQLAQLNWLRDSEVWEGNVVLCNIDPSTNKKSYKITASASAVRIAVNKAKSKLGWR
ncbi:DNA sulfur modification protein DndB [Ancylothrix sp. C2]|uniref:DNA sulfur modification protein DndB n=1 Tax=Ancylothrix sp. D3o TaxID=2953691 RepID=UPI0021BB2138|nr:DNA sulfur modification protein DndB [Ancylothrix sp. D3o]MCT7949352.1 DNA sulfur modification protein DndB [Ancylothrix sp. D3o]